MKKLIIFIPILLILVTSFCYGQEESKTYFGLKGGYHASKANMYHQIYRYNADLGSTPGYQAGIVMMNFLKPHYGIQMELNYTQKGYAQRFDSLADFNTDFDYIELPFLVNVHTGEKNLHFFINAGFFIEYLVKAKTRNLPDSTVTDDFYAFDTERDPRFGYGYRGGLGAFYDFKFGTLMLEGSYSYSLSNFFDPVTFDTGVPNITNNWVVGFTVGYLFSFTSLK